MHEVLVNRLAGKAYTWKKTVVRWTDRPDMTIAVDWEVKHQTKKIKYVRFRGNCDPAISTDDMSQHETSNNVVCATSKASDQPAHTRSLIRAFASRLSILCWPNVILEFLSLKGDCRGSSESTHVKTPQFLEISCTGSYMYRTWWVHPF